MAVEVDEEESRCGVDVDDDDGELLRNSPKNARGMLILRDLSAGATDGGNDNVICMSLTTSCRISLGLEPGIAVVVSSSLSRNVFTYTSIPSHIACEGKRSGEQYVSKFVDKNAMSVRRSGEGHFVNSNGRDVDPLD